MAREEKEVVGKECAEMKRKFDILEKQMSEKDEISRELVERVAQLDECLTEKNKECQALFSNIQTMKQAKIWQEQLYNDAYTKYQQCQARLAKYENEILDMDNNITHLESTNKYLRDQIETLEQEKAQLQGSAAQPDELAEVAKGLSQELIDSQIDYKPAVVINNHNTDDIINANENEDDGNFEPLIQLNEN